MSALAEFIEVVDEFDQAQMVQGHAPMARLFRPVPVPTTVQRISMNSPLLVELALTSLTGGGLVGTVVYVFKNPDRIGEWFPRIQTAWYNGRAEAERARKAYEKLHSARTRMRELE